MVQPLLFPFTALPIAMATVTLAATPASAQDSLDASAGEAKSEPILVLGQGLPASPATPAYSTVEIGREQIVSTSSGRLEDALSAVAGFQQFRRSDSRSSNPSAQGATLRSLGGNASSRALVLLDGVPMADPFFGYIPFSAVAPERLGLIRVTRGGGSGPFGAGALAGTIELESAGPLDLGPVSASALANQRAESELSATMAPGLGDGFAVFGGRWDRGQGFHTTPEAQRVAASARARFDAWSTSARLVQRVGPLEVQARGLAFADKRVLRFDGADSSSEGHDLSLRMVSRGAWQVDALAYAQWRNFTNDVISSTRFVRALDQKDTPSEGQGGKIELRPPLGDRITLRMGADFRRSAGNLFEDAYNAFTGARTEQRFAGGSTKDAGLFLENDVEFGPITLTGGMRLDRYSIAGGYYRSVDGSGATIRDDRFPDRRDWEATWRTGALWQADEALTLRAAAYTGLRLPTLNELYRPFVVFPVVTEANAALEPERLQGYEAGIDLAPTARTNISLTLFDNRVKDAIANVTLAANLRQRRNLDAIVARGVELDAGWAGGPFSVRISAAYTDAEVRGTGFAAGLDGNRPSQTPALSASATAAWRSPAGASVSASLRHVSRQFEGDQQDDVLPAATTIDLFAEVPVAGVLSAVMRVENLFDEAIVTRNQGGSIDLGVPRTVWAGLRYGF